MTLLPSEVAGTVFPTDEYCLGIRWWLGVPLLDSPGTCPGCSNSADVFGDHFQCCKRTNFSNRHDAVQDALFQILSSAGQSVSKEVPLQHTPDSQARPADLLLANWQGGKPTAVDVTVVHGWNAAAASSSAPVPRDNWRPYLRNKEAAKHTKYDAPCAREGWNFSALAFGTWGGVGPEGAKTLSRILKRTTAWEGPDHKGLAQRQHTELIGVALFRHIFRLLASKNFIA